MRSSLNALVCSEDPFLDMESGSAAAPADGQSFRSYVVTTHQNLWTQHIEFW